MKILLGIHHELNPDAGAPGSVLKLGHAYQALGHTVHYYSFDDLPAWVPKLATGLLFPEFVAAHLARTSIEQNLDVVDTSTGDAWVWGKFWRGHHLKRPLLVTHSHGLEHIAHLELLEEARRGKLQLSWKYPLYRGGFRLWEVAASLRCADRVLMLNRRDANYAADQLRVPPDKIHVVANGIPEAFVNLPFEPLSAANDSVIKIAQIGTYIPRKGTHYGSPALNQILVQHPQVKVSFLGTGGSAEQVYADFDPLVRDRICVVPSYSHADLPRLLQGHQILLFPSLSEGFPLAIPEAMACGLAPIATAIAGPTEIVVDGENGVLVPARDSQALVEACNQLMQNRDRLESLRHNAYARAQDYRWSLIAQQRLAIYESALERRGLG